MSIRKSRIFRVFAVAIAILATAAGGAAWSADHLDAPFVSLDGSIDINDVYVFNAVDPNKRVLVMTVNPGAGTISGTTFRTGASYEFVIDTDEDNRPDQTISTSFGPVQSDGRQRFRIQDVPTGAPPTTLATGFTGDDVQNGDVRVTVDIFDDPFFFDLAAFQGTDGRSFCDGSEVDFFAGLDVSAIVLELPKNTVGTDFFRIYGRTDLKGLQADRMGFPAINTVFIPSNPFEPDGPNVKDAFNATQPRGDRSIWSEEIKNNLRLFYTDDTVVDAIADLLLPDALIVNDALPGGFDFLNGRQLADDVIDLELALITNGAIQTDCIDANDAPFMTAFPYLAPAN